jgi:hypothetical protein
LKSIGLLVLEPTYIVGHTAPLQKSLSSVYVLKVYFISPILLPTDGHFTKMLFFKLGLRLESPHYPFFVTRFLN